MDQPDDYIIEKVEKTPDGGTSERVYFRSVRMGQGKLGLGTKLKIAAFVIAGIAVGTLLFLFFVSVFLYFFIPAVIVWALWSLFRQKGR